MDSPPSKKTRGDTSPKAFIKSDKGEIEKPNPETSIQLYDKGDCCDSTVIQSHTRAFKLDKSKSNKRKKNEKFDKKCAQHDDIILENMRKDSFQVKSPHIILSNKSFNNVKQNVIMLTKPKVENIPKNRKVYYKLKWIGDNIILNKKGKYRNVNVSSSKRNVVFILIAIHEISYMENLIFFTEKGDMITQLNLDGSRQGYVLIAVVKVTKSWQKKKILLSEERFNLTSRFYINQIKQTHGAYHFGTSGTIYGLGYGPKCHRNQFGHSIDRYSTSKYLFFVLYIYHYNTF